MTPKIQDEQIEHRDPDSLGDQHLKSDSSERMTPEEMERFEEDVVQNEDNASPEPGLGTPIQGGD